MFLLTPLIVTYFLLPNLVTKNLFWFSLLNSVLVVRFIPLPIILLNENINFTNSFSVTWTITKGNSIRIILMCSCFIIFVSLIQILITLSFKLALSELFIKHKRFTFNAGLLSYHFLFALFVYSLILFTTFCINLIERAEAKGNI